MWRYYYIFFISPELFLYNNCFNLFRWHLDASWWILTINFFLDVDDCLSSPCQNGVCTDFIGRYECQCDFGFIGDNCEENIDDCVDHACENNATCVDGAANYTCDCLYGYKGELCEVAMGKYITGDKKVKYIITSMKVYNATINFILFVVDGSWGEWGEWSSCSVTCGNGTQQRWRVCNDPAPDNGGLECPDNSTDSIPCIQDSCPGKVIIIPAHNMKKENILFHIPRFQKQINYTKARIKGLNF